ITSLSLSDDEEKGGVTKNKTPPLHIMESEEAKFSQLVNTMFKINYITVTQRQDTHPDPRRRFKIPYPAGNLTRVTGVE
ncbi:hypothetical protein L9F63_010933, partial [Diploptera punctata]